MTGIIVQLAISWLIIWWYEKGDLSCLGLMPSKKRLRDFSLFFLVAIIFSVSAFLLKMLIAKQSWELNPQLSAMLILKGIWFTIKSVLFEELIFRGVLLYILIKKSGPKRAILVSGIAFGIYHWFSFGVWGSPGEMLVVFLLTGIMGLVLAYGYARSFSLYIPVALHLGWNLAQMVIFSGNTIGPQIFVEVLPGPVVTISHFSFIAMQLLPVVSFWLFSTWLLKKYRQVSCFF